MSYNSILDAYFATPWIGLLVAFGMMPLYLLVIRRFIRKGKDYSFWESTALIAGCTVIALVSGLVNPLYWGYGRPQAIDEIRLFNGKLIVMDHIMTMGSEGEEGDRCSRIHVLDPMTGEKQLRFSVGTEANLIGIHGDSLGVSRYGDVAYYSVETGEKYVVYDKESLPGLFTELSSGIDSYMWGDGRNIMEITTLDGNQWNLYTATGKLVPANMKRPDGPYVPTMQIRLRNDEVRIDDRPGETRLLQLDGEDGNQHQLYLCDDNYARVNASEMFLDGKLAGLSVEDSCVFVISYESLRKERFKLSCMSLDGKVKLWEVKQGQLNDSYTYRDPYEPRLACDAGAGLVWLSIDEEVFGLGIRDGKVRWRMGL